MYFRKIQIGFYPFWYRLTLLVSGKAPLNVCVCVCVCVCVHCGYLFRFNSRRIRPADEEAAERAGGGQSEAAAELFDGRRQRQQPNRVDVRPRSHRLASVRVPGPALVRGQFAGPGYGLQRPGRIADGRGYQWSVRLQR